MNWASKHPLEVVAEWGAPILLAVAAGWAASALAPPFGWHSGRWDHRVGDCRGYACGWQAGVAVATQVSFEPVPLERCHRLSRTSCCWTIRLVEIAPDSRVVRLFATAEPTPGELVLRIEDYLNDGRRASAHRSGDSGTTPGRRQCRAARRAGQHPRFAALRLIRQSSEPRCGG